MLHQQYCRDQYTAHRVGERDSLVYYESMMAVEVRVIVGLGDSMSHIYRIPFYYMRREVFRPSCAW